nr:hypothetical protein [Rhodococcus sp. (in: high G+C Gram-positive bacteria)]
MNSRFGHLVVGPRTHGVVRYAASVHAASAKILDHHCVAFAETPRADVLGELSDCELVHVHVSDRLFGRTPASAADELRAMVGRLGRPVSVTLHDLPQTSDGQAMASRIAFYRDVAERAAGLVVSSRHEAALFREHISREIEPQVIPLMIEDHLGTRRVTATTADATVGVLGFLYPGKGHIEVLNAMAGLPGEVGFVVLGAPSAGHDYLVDELRSVAEQDSRSFEITGFLDDDDLHRRAAGITVPVAYHRHLSASGSINTWIALGRAPLVPRGTYTDELNSRSPGALNMHAEGDSALRQAISDAVADPTRTWIEPSVSTGPAPSDVARMHDDLFRRWAR